ncbi:esterase/lipase family protein [Aquabacterium sp. OR-4]|uniref:esterase/lipase family protein n=1 Tax=Aquabacterium sp. OR-4 TaxID=2978127 RepID=UPI0021B29217|nr:alpha/beta hydrolase [Aquabacterium sp. OR-4]MDT7838165.1 alpha/beta hydrolase [Aquabacterium sp. OR-4]
MGEPEVPARPVRFRLLARDVRGLSQLGVDAALGVTGLVEALHHTIARRTGIVSAMPAGRPGGITGLVYGAVRGSMQLAGRAADALLRVWPEAGSDTAAPSPEREAALAALNGVWGDHLAATGNPLATPMALRVGGQRLTLTRAALATALPGAGRRIVVLAHGLCMNDLQWQRLDKTTGQSHEHGAALARDLGFTPLWLHYNSGLHVSQNGRSLAALIEQLLAEWPQPVDELVVVGHSMGGLVARSAIHAATQAGMAWPARLTRLVCLGTPHHGAALERGGRWVDTLLTLSPYVAPFARLGKARSAGITDLRYGNLLDTDWQGPQGDDHRHAQHHDNRQAVPLPAGLAVFLMAATTAGQPSGLRHALLGDGLVSVASAWGEHSRAGMALDVPAARCALITRANHFDLLSRPEAYALLRSWLAEPLTPPA